MTKKILSLCAAVILSLCTGSFLTLAEGNSGDVITFGGMDYRLDDNTILLDSEGIYDSNFAIRDAAEAFRLANAAGGNVTILIAPSVYWLDDPDDPAIRTDKGGTPFAVRLRCDSLRMIGLTDNPKDVVFAVNRGQTQGAVGNFTMFEFDGKALTTENITFGNFCNTDLEYPRNPKLNRARRKDAIVQAQIGICRDTEKLFARNCRFLSRLNLCPFIGARRSLFEDCYFECTDDALAGSGIYFRCSFTFFSSKPFYSTDSTGAVFLDCDIHSKCRGTQYFTKVPGMITAIDTRFTSEAPLEISWTRDASDVRCFQQNITLNGKPYIIDALRPELGPSLAGKPLMDAYRLESDGKVIYNIFNLTKGTDGWDPTAMSGIIADLENTGGKQLTDIPVAMKLSATPKQLEAIGDTVNITTKYLLWGGFESGEPDTVIYVSDNRLPLPQRREIRETSPSGLEGSVTVDIKPNLRKAPSVKKAPKISYDKATGLYRVDYLISDKGEDESLIMWARLTEDESGKPQAFVVKRSKGVEGRTYKAKAADCFNSIVAIVTPKYKDSHPGEFKMSEPFEISDVESIEEMPEKTLKTDFSDVPIVERSPGIPGIWCFDIFKPEDTAAADWEAKAGSGWTYGKGFDASTGIGLIQTEKGARLSYLPTRDVCRDMEVRLVAEPAKSGGQGFGSATHQYMDICVKFDPVTLDGYALRIERTPDHDRAVSFSLIKYERGKTNVINKGVISNCYRTPCAITVGIHDGVLRATASTEAPVTIKCCDETVEEVNLTAKVDDSPLAGFCIQHTGSTGPSSTLIKNVDITWN